MRQRTASHLILPAAMVPALLACNGGSPSEPTPAPCTYTLSTTAVTVGASGGTTSVTVTTAGHCTWSAVSDRAWIVISAGASGTGPGLVTVTLSPNTTTEERAGTLTVAGQPVSVREEGLAPCSIDIAPAAASFGKDGGAGTFGVSAPGHCQWDAASNAPWLSVTAGARGTGNGTVTYAVDRNREVAGRTGTVGVAGRTFTVTQAGDPPAPVCDYSVAPVVFSPCMSVPYNLTASITAQPGCTWTAESDASWITVVGGQSGSGPGVVAFRVSDNWDAPRHGVVKVRWPTVTAGQNLQVSQAGCRYAVSTALISMSAAGGAGRFDVIQQSDPLTCGGATQDACLWTAVADVPWITITTSMPQAGDDPVLFTVAANASGSARTGRITVRDKVVRIDQAGQ